MTILNDRAPAPGQLLLQVMGYSLSAIASVLTVFPIGRDQDWLTALLLAAPVVLFILLLYAPQAFAMTERRSNTRTLNILLAAPVGGLVFIAFEAGVLDVTYAFVPAGLCAAIALLLGLGLAARRLPGSLFAGLVFFGLYGAAYGYGAMIFADTRLDHEQGRPFQTQVVQRYNSAGRSAHYHLVLAPWGPMPRQEDISVNGSLYQQADAGQTVCVTLYPGLLRMPWAVYAACPVN